MHKDSPARKLALVSKFEPRSLAELAADPSLEAVQKMPWQEAAQRSTVVDYFSQRQEFEKVESQRRIASFALGA